MEIDIEQELAGKNPARVAPQVRKQIRIQQLRVRSHLIMAFVSAGIFSLHLLLDWIPLWVAVCALIVFPISLLCLYGDGRLLKYQQQKLTLIEEILKSRGKQ
ncbi:hypothetical protein FYZ48_00750 [Gimesia chilikensis]|uniref:hypothetical protein n=1 Tax=Gimesia chilikensis TaxID=2605989 RepID=UPI0011EC9EA0|nr:hypothetical protein [Gimesia chilikensis]KAA0142936.1 hypothetical protein FYZ48_00750 [Gimesia chilikensis]